MVMGVFDRAAFVPRPAAPVWVRMRVLAVAALLMFGSATAGVMAAMELDAQRLSSAVERLEAGAGPARLTAMQAFRERMSTHQPLLGGAPRYWDTASRGYLLAAAMPHLRAPERVEMLDLAEESARRALVGRPHFHGPWSRLASIDVARDGELSPQGAQALRHAWRAAPRRERLAAWRFGFMAPLWPQLPDDLRAQMVEDGAFLWSRRNTWRFRKIVRQSVIGAPDGLDFALRRRIPDLHGESAPALRSTVPARSVAD